MQSSPPSNESAGCPVCRADLTPGQNFCGRCGSSPDNNNTPAQEIRSLNYLLSELALWEENGLISPEQAKGLRESYELRREELRAELLNGRAGAPTHIQQQTPPQQTNYQAWQYTQGAQPFYPPPRPAPLPRPQTRPHAPRRTRRPLLETLADPQTIRLLLYTGAAMLVVGVVIWLRDILYLKLQEPVVQATLLAVGTLAVTASGWLVILRTRLLLTGRALTLTGSLLVPVNFWFLVRSGLIENNGRAWVVCAFCTLLYAHTAALLRERLYVYLAGIAAHATAWTLVYRNEPEAYGLYALTLMLLSLAFLHLTRLLPLETDEPAARDKQPANNETAPDAGTPSREPTPAGRFGYALWGPPLVQLALAGAALGALFYMPLRLGSAPSFDEGILRLRASEYDPGIAMLLFVMGAYAAWFTGRYVYPDRRAPLHIISALALFWTEFLALDGMGVSGTLQLSILAAMALAVSLAARMIKDDALALPIHRAGLIACVLLSAFTYPALMLDQRYTSAHSAALFFVAAAYAVSSTPRFCVRAAQRALACASAVFASAAFLVTLISLDLRSNTLFFAACSAWPFILYAAARLAVALGRETQLVMPFTRTADAEAVLLMLLGGALAADLNQATQYGGPGDVKALGPMFCLLTGATFYGALRSWLERSVLGAALMSAAALVLVAALGDTLKYFRILPAAWPVATAVVISAFLLHAGARRLLRPGAERAAAGSHFIKIVGGLSRHAIIQLVADCAVLACASLWFAAVVYSLGEVGTSPAVVLFLSLLYWGERAAGLRRQWPVYVCAAHAAALFVSILSVLRVDPQWFAALSVLALFPSFFAVAHVARARGAEWLARPASVAAQLLAVTTSVVSLMQALAHLRVGDPLLLAPSVALGALALLLFGASLLSVGRARVNYFRAGLYGAVLTFVLACLRAGFDPAGDVELYTTPVALLLLSVAYLSARRGWEEFSGDEGLLLWLGSLLLSAPLLLHALQYRLLLGVPAPWRDLATLLASLALILFGVAGRARAPVMVGASSLVLELVLLAATSVNWLQVPLKVYLISAGVLILVVWGMLEFRREQILLLRQRINERRDYARERFGEWR